MNFLELEDICKSPVPPAFVETHRASIREALDDYKSWDNDPTEEQQTLHDIVWDLSKTWSYEMISELMPHLSVENQTTELVRMVEAVGGENEIEHNKHLNLKLCEPFFKQHICVLPIQEQIEVLRSLINQSYSNSACLATAVRLCEITTGAIDWGRYEQERQENDKFHWSLPSEVTLATEHRTEYPAFFESIKKACPEVFLFALQYVVAMQTQGGYCPSPDRLELFNNRLLPFLSPTLYEDLMQTYSTVNTQLQRHARPPLELPPSLLNFVLHKELNTQAELSTAVRGKKM